MLTSSFVPIWRIPRYNPPAKKVYRTWGYENGKLVSGFTTPVANAYTWKNGWNYPNGSSFYAFSHSPENKKPFIAMGFEWYYEIYGECLFAGCTGKGRRNEIVRGTSAKIEKIYLHTDKYLEILRKNYPSVEFEVKNYGSLCCPAYWVDQWDEQAL